MKTKPLNVKQVQLTNAISWAYANYGSIVLHRAHGQEADEGDLERYKTAMSRIRALLDEMDAQVND